MAVDEGNPHHRHHGADHDRHARPLLLRRRFGLQRDRQIPPRPARLKNFKGYSMSRWYIIHAYSGFENKVRDAILSEARRLGLEQLVEAVEVPTETVTEIKRGKKVQAERKFMPGYVLAKLALNDDVYHLVKNTPKVTGFLGPNGKPQAISEASRAHPFNPRRSRRRRPEAARQGRLRDRRCSEGPRRPLRQLQRRRGRTGLRSFTREGQR